MLLKALHTISPAPSRRRFLIGAVAAPAGFVVGYYLLGRSARAEDTAEMVNPFAGYVEIGADDKVTVLSAHMDMGQGCYNGVATLVAEELDADWSQMRGELAPAADVYRDPGFGIQMTGGSGSIARSYTQYREVVNPLITEWFVRHLVSGEVLVHERPAESEIVRLDRPKT